LFTCSFGRRVLDEYLIFYLNVINTSPCYYVASHQHHETSSAALPGMSSLSASAASILLHAFVLTTLLLAATCFLGRVAHHGDDVNTTMFANGSLTSTPSAENWEMYYCFLCTGRHPLLIHYCPIYLDECHLNCWDAIPEASSAGRRRPTPRRCRARSATS
jgi:hypothetical protein